MVEITCQHSGLKFEAKTKRTKQHPDVAAFKNAASKDGSYREANEALDAIAKQGGYTTVKEYLQLVAEYANNKVNAKNRSRLEQAAARDAAKQELHERRQRENNLLKANGYEWQVEYVDRDAPALETRDEGKYFYLVSPDGRIVTKSQALDEIERGVETVQAEQEAQKQEAEQKRIEQEQAKTEKETEYNKRNAEYQAILAEKTDGFTQVAHTDIDYKLSDFTKVAYINRGTHYTLYHGTIDGVDVYIETTFGNMAYAPSVWVADAKALGLTALSNTGGSYFF